MDHEYFDDLTRSAASGEGTRRAVLGLLAGGAMIGIAARFGLTQVAAAKAKHKQTKSKQQQKSRPERKAHGELQAEGKHKRKKRHKKPKLGVVCSLDPECEAGGGRCCDDGKCVAAGACCSNEKPCGGGCIRKTSCCPTYEKLCDDGSCVPRDQCCLGERSCFGDDACVAADECCPSEKPCRGGECVPRDMCCTDEKPCYGGCIAKDACCPDAPYPDCSKCDSVVCEHGEHVCRGNHDCPSGGWWNPERCRCEFCEEDCGDPRNDLCRSPQCKDGERCIEGICQVACADPLPQLCCVQDPYFLDVRCYCTAANEICFNCGFGNVCACIPGDPQICCDPNNPRQSNCPEACHCPRP